MTGVRKKIVLADYIFTKPVIDTGRLTLRPMCAKDVPALKEWLPDPSIYTYWGKGPSKAEKNPELLFEKDEKPTKSFHLGIEEKASGKVIGDLYVYLIENDRMASVAIRLAPACQGKGYGTEFISMIENRLAVQGYHQIFLFTDRNKPAYHRRYHGRRC